MSKFAAFKSLSFMVQDKCDVLVSFSDTGRGDLRCDFKVFGDRDYALKGFHCDLKDPDLAEGSRIEGERLSGTKCGDDRHGDYSRDRHHKRDHDRDDRDHDDDARDDDHDTDRDCGARFEDDDDHHGCREGSFTLSHDDCALSIDDLCGADFEVVVCQADTGEETVLGGETPDTAEGADEDFAEEIVDEDDQDTEEADDQGLLPDQAQATLPLIDATEEELAAMSQADEVADEQAELPDFI